DAADKLGKAGATIREVKLPQSFAGLHAVARGTINFHERAACMAYEWDHHRAALSPQMRRYIENGQKTSRQDYIAGWRRVEECRCRPIAGRTICRSTSSWSGNATTTTGCSPARDGFG